MNKTWNYSEICVTGARHEREKMMCQDRAAYYNKDTRQAMVLVDGIGKTDQNALAGGCIAQCIAELLTDKFDFFMEASKEDGKWLLLRDVRRMIEKFMVEYEMPKEEFGSTIMAVAIDHLQETYCIVHLGDGIIIRKNEERNIEIISYPETGWASNQTYLTISENALQKLRLLRGKLGDTSEFALLSDGGYTYPIKLPELSKTLDKNIINFRAEDDYSIARLTK